MDALSAEGGLSNNPLTPADRRDRLLTDNPSSAARRQSLVWLPALIIGVLLTTVELAILSVWNQLADTAIPAVLKVEQLQATGAPSPADVTPAPKPQVAEPPAKPAPPSNKPARRPRAPRSPEATPLAEVPPPPLADPPTVSQSPQPSPAPEATSSVTTPPEIPATSIPIPVPIFQLTALPRFASYVEPEYPPSMRHLGKETKVQFEVLIDSVGIPREITIVHSGGAEFDAAVINALQHSTFVPARVGEKAVATLWRSEIKFRLK